jgi:superfamily II DNA or RNA helicase
MAAHLRSKGKRIPLPSQFIYRCYPIPVGHPWAGGLMAPRHIDVEALNPDLKLYRQDCTTFPEADKVVTQDGFRLRDYQSAPLDSLEMFTSGYVVAPCGAGKTSIGMGAISRIQTKAVILVHTNDLAQQWVDRIAKQLCMEDGSPVPTSIVGDGKRDDSGRVVVALFQTLSRMTFTERYEFGKQFGLVVADECHHVPSETFNTVMCCMPAKFRLGLTATPERTDNMQDVLDYQMAMRLGEIKIADLAARNLVTLPRVRFVRTGFRPDGNQEWAGLITSMSEDVGRNNKIVEEAQFLVEGGRQVLILSDRVEHCEVLADRFNQMGIKASALVGKMSQGDRRETLRLADEGHYQVVTATSLADEGLDLPGLGAVILTSPSKAMGRIQQRVGRVMRPKMGKKQPVVVDLVDDGKAFEGLAKKRARLYKSLGCLF